MIAVSRAHTKKGIAGFHHCHKGSGVGLRTGMRLYVCILGAEQFFCPLNSQVFYFINKLTAAVVTLVRIAFCVFVGQL